MKNITYEKIRPFYKPVCMMATGIGAVLADAEGLHSKGPVYWPGFIIRVIIDLPPALLAGWLLAKIAESGILTWWKR